MTTIYVPRLIESAEQAEALPVNTLAISADGVDPAIRKEDGWHGIFGDPPYSHAEMVSDYALVPIEAEEELAHLDPWEGVYDPTTREEAEELGPLPAQPLHTRLVTPWESA